MKIFNTSTFNFLILLLLVLCSCKKQDEWLSVKSNKNTTIPATISDFQGLMDYSFVMNYLYPTAGLMGTDNFYIPDASFSLVNEAERNLYTWKSSIWVAGNSSEWNNVFKIIGITNVVLEGLEKLPDNTPDYKNVKGQALFNRAFNNYQLAQLYCKTYNASTAAADLGIPLRVTSDANVIVQRSTLQDTYVQIIADAEAAGPLLATTQPYLQRPVRAAAYALLAKTYLIMGDYPKAKENADIAISLRPGLINFNTTNAISTTTYRFSAYGKDNAEILYYAYGGIYTSVSASTSGRGVVAPELYQSYNDNDLRKSVLYIVSAGLPKYRGNYSGTSGCFCGIANNEVYLIRAECLARLGRISDALTDLNYLLVNRYKTGTFTALTASDAGTALGLILRERRKELPFVGNIRWEDLRRLNLDPAFRTDLIRSVNGTTYSLPANDKRYALPIPDNEVQLSGLQQNER